MPTYQYACTNADCGNRFDLVQKFTDPAADECPVCGSPVRKVFSSVGVVFKGSGFYRNDSREGAGKSKDGAASGSDNSSKEASSAKSSDAKSDGGAKKDSGTATSSSTSTSSSSSSKSSASS